MKYTVTQHKNVEGWIVKIGRAKSDGGFQYTGTAFATEAEAQAEAASRNALHLMEQVRALIPEMPLQDAKNVGFEANMMIDDICDRCEAEDPDHSPMDARGWLA